MAPVDGLRPPKKKKATPVKQAKTAVPVAAPVMPAPSDQQHRYRLMWLLVGATLLVIIIGWAVLIPQTFSGGTSKSTYLEKVGDNLGNLWDSFKKDVLRLKDTTTNQSTSTEEERIQQLEEKVFPQFEDPSRQ